MVEKYSTTSVARIFRKAKNKAFIRKHTAIYALRDSFATHLSESGTDFGYTRGLFRYYPEAGSSGYKIPKLEAPGTKKPERIKI